MSQKKDPCCDDIPQIIQGEQRSFIITVLDENSQPEDISGATLVQAFMPAGVSEGTFVRFTDQDALDPIEIIAVPTIGKLRIIVNKSKSKLLKEGPRQEMLLFIDFPDAARGRKGFKVPDAYSVCAFGFDLDSPIV